MLSVEVKFFLAGESPELVTKRLTAFIPFRNGMVLKWHQQALLRLLPLNLSLIRINHSKNQEISKVMWKLPFFCCLVPSNAGLVWNRKGGLIIKRKKANLLIFYGCLVLLYRLHVSVSLGLSIGFHFSQLEVNKSGLDMETAEKLWKQGKDWRWKSSLLHNWVSTISYQW